MHHSTVLHDPRRVATPSQLAEQLAHKKRHDAIARAAVPEVVTALAVEETTPAPAPKTGEELIAEWTERQKERFQKLASVRINISAFDGVVYNSYAPLIKTRASNSTHNNVTNNFDSSFFIL